MRRRACAHRSDDVGLLAERRQAVVPGRQVYFDCSMLQKAIEGADGSVKWEDVSCDADADDFAMLWSREWLIGDFGVKDETLSLVAERPDNAWLEPARLFRSLKEGRGDYNRAFVGGADRLLLHS